MRAFVRFRLPDGSTRDLGDGDLLGRQWSAALCLDDPRVSQAHAMVSLRGASLKLLGLRRMFAVGGTPRSEVELAPGLAVELAPGLTVVATDVVLPEEVLAVEVTGLPRHVLTGVCSIRTRPFPALAPGPSDDAEALVWTDGAGWRFARIGEPASSVGAGDVASVGGLEIRFVSVRLERASQPPTALRGGVEAPLRVVASWDTVHVHREGEPVLVLAGVSARLVSELVTLGGPVGWEVLARELWPEEPDRSALRNRLDAALFRLRAKLKEARIRADLVATGGTGQIELVLRPGDVAEDRT